VEVIELRSQVTLSRLDVDEAALAEQPADGIWEMKLGG
jgi:hypothetical protein